jgi:hypothetical protein
MSSDINQVPSIGTLIRTAVIHVVRHMTAGWSNGLRSRLRNQRSRVQILVVSGGFCDEQFHLLTSRRGLYLLLLI